MANSVTLSPSMGYSYKDPGIIYTSSIICWIHSMHAAAIQNGRWKYVLISSVVKQLCSKEYRIYSIKRPLD